MTAIPNAASSVQLIAEQRAAILTRRRARARIFDRIATISLWTVAGIITLVFAYIVLYTVLNGFRSITSLNFFTSGDANVGIGPQLWNTFYLLFLSLVVMIPIGTGAAIYMVEYAAQGLFIRSLRFAVETLTSTPSSIIGLLGYLLFVTHVGNGLFWGPTRLSGALVLAILNIPWMLRTAEDALRAVPRDFREGSLALGATKLQTISRVILPAAIPGLVTGVLIVAGRVIGESAALFFSAGTTTSQNGWFNLDLFKPGDTLAIHSYDLFAETPGANAHMMQLGTSLVLIVLVLILNVLARVIGEAVNTRLSGKKS
jgi:phosphate transport system permease protein